MQSKCNSSKKQNSTVELMLVEWLDPPSSLCSLPMGKEVSNCFGPIPVLTNALDTDTTSITKLSEFGIQPFVFISYGNKGNIFELLHRKYEMDMVSSLDSIPAVTLAPSSMIYSAHPNTPTSRCLKLEAGHIPTAFHFTRHFFSISLWVLVDRRYQSQHLWFVLWPVFNVTLS